jgi:hypothetical protein
MPEIASPNSNTTRDGIRPSNANGQRRLRMPTATPEKRLVRGIAIRQGSRDEGPGNTL